MVDWQEFRWRSVFFPRWKQPCVTDSFTAHPGSPACTRGSSIVQPGWTHIVCGQERIWGSKRFDGPGTTSRQLRGRCQQGWGRRKGNKFSPWAGLGPTSVPLVIRPGNCQTQAEQETDHSQPSEDPTPPWLHRESTSRACRKFRSLFSSASSRKRSCSSCQAATPCRVASAAACGT
jgi:hypothetical protein